MRWLIITFALMGSALHAIQIGDARESVIAELGAPIGELDLGDRVRLMFTEGDVTLIDGKVSSHAIKTTAQLDREAEVREVMAQQWAERRAEDQATRIDKGRAWLDYLKLASTALTEQDIQALMGHWQGIQKEYPEADVAAEYEATLALAEARAEEIKQHREEQRIAGLEQRIAAAEQRAAAAEQQAWQSQQTVSYSTYGNAFPYYYRPPQSVVVISGSGVNCVTPYRPQYKPKPILEANYSNDNFSISYNSGPSNSLLRQNYRTPSRPIVITTSGN